MATSTMIEPIELEEIYQDSENPFDPENIEPSELELSEIETEQQESEQEPQEQQEISAQYAMYHAGLVAWRQRLNRCNKAHGYLPRHFDKTCKVSDVLYVPVYATGNRSEYEHRARYTSYDD